MNLKELQKLISLCRKSGVLSIKMEGVELTLSEETPAAPKPRGKAAQKAATANAPSRDPIELEGEMTPEQLMYWSTNYVDAEGAGQ